MDEKRGVAAPLFLQVLGRDRRAAEGRGNGNVDDGDPHAVNLAVTCSQLIPSSLMPLLKCIGTDLSLAGENQQASPG